ncbi:hypothetical protein ACLKA6_008261 [Drosophila palustris]
MGMGLLFEARHGPSTAGLDAMANEEGDGIEKEKEEEEEEEEDEAGPANYPHSKLHTARIGIAIHTFNFYRKAPLI